MAIGSVCVRSAVYGRAGGGDALVPLVGHEAEDYHDHREHENQAGEGDGDGEAPLGYADVLGVVDCLGTTTKVVTRMSCKKSNILATHPFPEDVVHVVRLGVEVRSFVHVKSTVDLDSRWSLAIQTCRILLGVVSLPSVHLVALRRLRGEDFYFFSLSLEMLRMSVLITYSGGTTAIFLDA